MAVTACGSGIFTVGTDSGGKQKALSYILYDSAFCFVLLLVRDKVLGDLHGIQGRTLADLVAHRPERDAVGVREVFAHKGPDVRVP